MSIVLPPLLPMLCDAVAAAPVSSLYANVSVA
jgi:hypothetical protein